MQIIETYNIILAFTKASSTPPKLLHHHRLRNKQVFGRAGHCWFVTLLRDFHKRFVFRKVFYLLIRKQNFWLEVCMWCACDV